MIYRLQVKYDKFYRIFFVNIPEKIVILTIDFIFYKMNGSNLESK